MANTLLTIGGITRKALSLWRNSNSFLQQIDRQYDSSFGVTGAKIGSTLRIRLPNDYTVRNGQVAVPQGTNEQSVTMTVATQRGVDVTFSSNELSLSLDSFSDRILSPMVNVLAGDVAKTIMGLVEGVPNIVHNVTGTATISPTAATFLQAGAVLDQLGAPRGNRKVVVSPMTQARVVSSMSGLFNPTNEIGRQYKMGQMTGTSGALGFESWYMDQSVITHSTSDYGTLGTVTGMSATDSTGQTLSVSALAGPIYQGDFVTIEAVHGVNRVSKQSHRGLAQFVVTANASTGATSLKVYPPLKGPVGGNTVPYQTVDALPVAGAHLASPIAASELYWKNIAFLPEAFTLVTADLELPTGAVVDAAREQYDGISLRMVRDYITTTDQWLTRLDILFGYASPRPDWAVVIADMI